MQLYKTFVLMCVDKVLAHLEVCAAKLEMWILEVTGVMAQSIRLFTVCSVTVCLCYYTLLLLYCEGHVTA